MAHFRRLAFRQPDQLAGWHGAKFLNLPGRPAHGHGFSLGRVGQSKNESFRILGGISFPGVQFPHLGPGASPHCDPGAELHVGMAFFKDARGVEVARTLREKRDAGCGVHIIVGNYLGDDPPSPSQAVQDMLRGMDWRTRYRHGAGEKINHGLAEYVVAVARHHVSGVRDIHVFAVRTAHQKGRRPLFAQDIRQTASDQQGRQLKR
jgi:hypothetical protein